MLCSTASWAATNVSGSITTNTTWTLAGSPYLVTGSVYVYGTATTPAILTIEAGGQVQFNQYGSLTVGSGSNLGGLKVLGTASSPVLFTSSQATKTRGYWDRITFSSATDPLNTVLQYATAEYGGSGGVGILYVSGASPTLQNVTVRETNNYGIYVVQGGLALQSVVTSGTGGSYAMSLPADVAVTSSGTHSFDKPIELRSGTISKDTTWRNLGAPYVSTGVGINVYKDTTTAATLTIEPGVEVRFAQGRSLAIGGSGNKGTLTAQGTSTAPILFTSNQTTKTPGYWNGLSFNAGAGSTSVLDFVTIEYCGPSGYANLNIYNASPTVKNSTLRQSSTYGVAIYGASSAPSLQSTTIRDNGGIGLWQNQGNLSLQSVTVSGTAGTYAMSLPADLTVSSSGTHSFDKPIELRSGNISGTTTWRNLGAPYVSPGDISVYKDTTTAATLTIEAGVEVRFAQGRHLAIGGSGKGTLSAQGTSSAPILFTSNQTTKTQGSWYGLSFQSGAGSTSVLDFVTIEYANTNLAVYDASPTVKNSTLRQSSTYGAYVSGASSAPSFQSTAIRDNAGIGLFLNQGSNLSLQSMTFAGTGGTYAMSLPADATVTSSGAHSFDKPIELRGNISGTTTWRNLGAPYVSTGGINVYKDTTTAATLTVEPGVEVRFAQGRSLAIGNGGGKGTLSAQGTSTAPILFTSNQTTKTPGYWYGLSFQSGAGSTSVLDFVTIEYANTNLAVYDASPTVKNSTLRQSSTYGVAIYNASSAPSLQSTTIRDNGGIGLWLNPGANLSLQTMTFSGTGGTYAMSLPADATVTSSGTHSFDKPIELRSATISKDTTWRNLGAPYVSTSSLYVYKDATTAATLTIEAGVEVRFGRGAQLSVGSWGNLGALAVQGTGTSPVLLTSDQTAKTRGSWCGLSFQSGSGGLVQFATVEYGGYPGGYYATAAINIQDTSPTIRNTTVRESAGPGISVTGPAVPALLANAFAGETGNAVNNTGSKVLDARASWWNNASGPSGAASGTGEAVSTSVLTNPWLGSAANPLYYASQAQISKLFFSSKNDSTTLTATLSAPGSWTLQVLNSTSTVVRTYTGTGSTLSQAWDGRDSKKSAVADGTYTLRLTATASTGGQAMAPLVGHVVVTGGTSPVAVISAPKGGAVLRGGDDVWVVGTATDANDFVSYKAEVGAGSAPTSWGTLVDSTTPVVDARLATWPTSGLTGSTYTLRLTTKDARSSATAQATVKLMTVLNPQLSQRYFSPNGDGVNETTTFSATLTLTANWTLTFKDGAGVAVRTLTGSGTSVSQVWNGKNDSGAPVAEGTYSYTFQAVEATSGVAAFAVTGLTTVDLNVPTAQITAPTANATVFDTITITGTAYDPSNFVNYYVDYGAGASPASWTNLCGSGYPVQNGTLCVWRTNSFRDEVLVASGNGVYTFRLTVTDSAGSVKTARVTVNLDNMLVSGVSASRSTIRPVDSETSTIGFTINQPATVSVRILPETTPRKVFPDQTAETGAVRTLSLGSLAAGPHTAVWDGKDGAGRIVTDEAYTYVIEARAASTRFDKFNEYLSPTTTFNPWGPSIPASVLSYDPYKNQFVSWDYSVTAGPGRCGLCVMWLDSQDHWTYFWPQNNTLRTVGTASAFWDGRDQAGNIVSGAGMKWIRYFVGYNGGGTYDYGYLDWCQGIKTNYVLVQGSNPRVPGISIKSDPYVMYLSYGGVTRLQYTLEDAARVTITVGDPLTGVEATILSGVSQAAGDQEVVWEGRDASGRLMASEGNYTFSIIATHPVSGQSTTRRGNITVFK